MTSAHVLVVDDEPDIRVTVKDILEDEGYTVSVAESAAAAREARRQQRPDVVLLDIWMPDLDGISLLREWNERGGLPCPVIMMSGHGTIETAIEATRQGAWDFVEKPISLAKLLLTVERANEAGRLKRENEGLKSRLPAPAEPIGSSVAIQTLRTQLEKLAGHDAWVLIQGEPGCGKEMLARWLHERSARRAEPFVSVAAAAPREIASFSVFGRDDGSDESLIEKANGGTLFIDEVGQLDAELQQRLHTILEQRSLPRGGGREPLPLDLRVVATTSLDLAALVRTGAFREDLFYQLNVVAVSVPPLRERPEDVPELLRYHTDFFSNRDKLAYRAFPVAVQNRLRNYPWPGNTRELRNLVQRLLIMGSGAEISLDEVEQALASHPLPPTPVALNGLVVDFSLPLREARDQFERAYLLHQLGEASGSVGKLAKAVGMERTHLYRKLKDLGIDPRAYGRED